MSPSTHPEKCRSCLLAPHLFVRQKIFTMLSAKFYKHQATKSGEFIYTKKYNDESFAIIYLIKKTASQSELKEERVLIKPTQLFVSNFVAGENAPLDIKTPF